jgi:predicted transcriptional regulator
MSIEPRHFHILALFQQGSFTSLQLAEMTGISRNVLAKSFSILMRAGYLQAKPYEHGKRGRVIYSLRPGVAIPEVDKPPKFKVTVKKQKAQDWFSAIVPQTKEAR